MTVQPGLCPTWSETQIVGFLKHRLKKSFSEIMRENRIMMYTLDVIFSDSLTVAGQQNYLFLLLVCKIKPIMAAYLAKMSSNLN